VRPQDDRQYQRVNIISSVTKDSKVSLMLCVESIDAKRLIRDAKKIVSLNLDNLRVHHAKLFKSWVEAHSKQISLFYLPSYSPDLNLDEYLNCDLKRSFREKPGTVLKRFSRLDLVTTCGCLK
jgi:hypothetical protein